jgi:hypothetical protein
MERGKRARELARTCAACFGCDRPLRPKEPVWLVAVDTGRGWRGRTWYETTPHCQACYRAWYSESPWRKKLTPREDGSKCPTCGRTVIAGRERRKRAGKRGLFCCARCRWACHNARRSGPAAREKTCAVCGVAFTAPRNDAVTCSPACRQKAYRQRQKGKGR